MLYAVSNCAHPARHVQLLEAVLSGAEAAVDDIHGSH